MNKRSSIITIFISLLLIILLFSGCRAVVVPEGSGNTVTKEYEFRDFTGVEIGYAFEYKIVRADNFKIAITARDNLFEHIAVKQEGDILKISKKTPSAIFNIGTTNYEAVIEMPELNYLDSSGATRGTISGFSSEEKLNIDVSGASSLDMEEISAGAFDLEVSGASNVDGAIETREIELGISGASKVSLEGTATDMDADISGASRLRADALSLNDVDITISGASNATVNLAGRLDADISGASTLEYIGQPTLGSLNISGSSNIKKK